MYFPIGEYTLSKDPYVSTLFAPYLISWMNKHKGDVNIEYSDITSKYHMYVVQGPKSKDMINSLVKENIDEVPSADSGMMRNIMSFQL
ncbi:MAG: hypothetical protein E6371_04045 [Terrisporobacter othiniensis]|uniref:hypothetical protein n=2 Tax=Terrisporobacter TaxID=1505652 RepID=UPI00093E7930|nr:hypothetical protein [Terrisporobacter othiniensis]MDU6983564.1 hypothetical protein [Terrisporobacter othiniensis]